MKKFLFFIIVIGVIGFVFYQFLGGKFLVPHATQLIFQKKSQLDATDGHTNILLLGIGGGTHDGPNLTDTIIFASINPDKKSIALVSVPRDLWIPSLQNGNGGKINVAYADGQDNNNQGLVEAKKTVSTVVGQPIHYGFRIDFDGFVKVIDELGGIDINVPATLDDYNYPIEGKEDDTCGHATDEIQTFTATASADQDIWAFFPCRYKHLHVSAGQQHMDGTTALEYVRSRHAAGNQGTDFARSRRQQLVIEAVRSQLLSTGTLLNPGKILSLYNIVKDSIDTDIPENQFVNFITLFASQKDAKISTTVLDYGDYTIGRPGILTQPPMTAQYDYASVLIPRLGTTDYSEIHWLVACELQGGLCDLSPTPGLEMTPTPTPVKKK